MGCPRTNITVGKHWWSKFWIKWFVSKKGSWYTVAPSPCWHKGILFFILDFGKKKLSRSVLSHHTGLAKFNVKLHLTIVIYYIMLVTITYQFPWWDNNDAWVTQNAFCVTLNKSEKNIIYIDLRQMVHQINLFVGLRAGNVPTFVLVPLSQTAV